MLSCQIEKRDKKEIDRKKLRGASSRRDKAASKSWNKTFFRYLKMQTMARWTRQNSITAN